MTKSFYRDVRLLSRLLNFTVTCPQVYITGNSSDTVYVQPSLQVGWWNASNHTTQKLNISMGGLLKLEYSEDNSANFTGRFSYLNASNPTMSTSKSNAITMLDVALAGLNAKNPLPQGPALEADINIQVTNGTNGTNVVLFSASNFTFSLGSSRNNNGSTGTSGTSSSSNSTEDDEVFQVLLVQNASSFDRSAYRSSTEAFGDYAANITQLNNTCSGTNYSSNSSKS